MTEVTTTTEATTETTEKSKRQMSFTVLENGTIQANFGETLDPLTLDPAAVPEALRLAAVTEGLISRARSAASKLTDADRTPENLRVAVEKAFQNLLAGVWKIERTAGAGAEVSLEVEAAWLFQKMRAESQGQEYTTPLADVVISWAALSDEQKEKVKALPRYQAARSKVKAAREAVKAEKLMKAADKAEADAPF